LSFQLCKFGAVLTLLFVVPAVIEIDSLLDLWLKTPPAFASKMCVCMLVYIVIEKISGGHVTAVNATGNIAKFQVMRGLMLLSVVPLALLASSFGLGPVATTGALVVAGILQISSDIIMARLRVGMSASYWLLKVALPVGVAAACAFFCGVGVRSLFLPGVMRICMVGITTTVVLAGVSWGIILNAEEKNIARHRLNVVFSRMGCRMKERHEG